MIAAAGSGLRLGAGCPKALVELHGRPLLEWSLLALGAAATIEAIVVAAPAGHEAEVEELTAGRAEVLAGGASRAESVRLALGAVRGELVAIHDAARPLISPQLVDRVVSRLSGDAGADGVIAAAPLADTVKRAGAGDVVAATVDRRDLWAAQTPQAFRVAALRSAQAAAHEAGELDAATDEAWLIERTGGTVLLEPVGAFNLKVTDPADLTVAEVLLSVQGG